MLDTTCRILRRLTRFRAYWLLMLEPDDIPDNFKLKDCTLKARVFRGDELSSLAGRHRDLGEKFIARSKLRGDWCHAYFDGHKLASYGWCSTQPTRVGDYFYFSFPGDYIYMHRGFTMREYRGAYLNGYGMVEAVRLGASEGKRGLVGLVEVQNVASLRSADRLGFRREGKIFAFRMFGHWMTLRTTGCRLQACGLVRH